MIKHWRKLPRRIPTSLDLILLTLLSWPALRPLLAPGYLATDDGLFHLFRLVELNPLLKAGELYPRLAPDLAQGYDYPVFNYYAPLALYVSELFHLLGFSATDAVKAAYGLSIIGAVWAMRLLLDDLLPRSGALLGAFAYGYVPYLLLNVYVRGALAEAMGMALLPVALWAVRRLAREPSVGTVSIASSCLAGLVLTHNITALLAMPVLAGYWLLSWLGADRRRGWRMAFPAALVAATLALALSTFYWAPALGELQFVQASRLTTGFFDFHRHLQPLRHLFTRALIYNYHTTFGLRFRVGPAQIVLAAAGFLVALVWSGARRREGLFWGVVLAGALFLMWTHSAFVWERLPLMHYAQFPWRWLSVVGVATSVLIGYLTTAPRLLWAWIKRASSSAKDASAHTFSVRWALVSLVWIGCLGGLIAVAALTDLNPGRLDLRNIEARPWTEQQMESAINSIAFSPGEYLPQWAKPSVSGSPSWPAQPGEVQLTVQSAGPFFVNLDVVASRPMPVILDRFFFPGWQARVDGRPVPTRASGSQGLLTVDVPAGDHHLEIFFGNTPLRAVTSIISGAALLVFVGLGLYALRGNLARRRSHSASVATSGWSSGRGSSQLLNAVPAVVLALTTAMVGIGVFGTTIQQRVVSPRLAATATFGDDVRLAGATVNGTDGDRLDLTLYWQALRRIGHDDAIRLRLIGAAGQVVGERTKPPSFGLRSTLFWQDGELVRDHEEISLQPGEPAGEYTLRADVIDLRTDTPVRPVTSVTTGDTGISLGKVWVPARPKASPPPLAKAAHAIFGDQVALTSYQLQPLGPKSLPLPARTVGQKFLTVRPGDQVRVAVQWQLLRDLEDNETVFVHLVDRHGRLVSQKDGWPRNKFYPTILWIPGEVVPDAYDLEVPNDAPPGLYDVSVGLYQLADLKRLPLTNGRPGESSFSLGTIKVLPRKLLTLASIAPRQRDNATFADGVALLGHTLTTSPPASLATGAVKLGSQIDLTFYWQAQRRPSHDYTIFIHVLNGAGNVVAQADGQPLQGDEPTSAWDPGEIVADQHAVRLPANLPPGRYQVTAGLYLLKTGVRLKLQNGADHLVLQSIDVVK